MNLPLLDASQLQQLLDLDEGKAGLLREMTALFKGETPQRLQALRGGIEAGNPAVVMAAAHALKGASGLMGAQRVFALARELEMNARMGSLPSRELSMEAWAQLDNAVSEAHEALDNFLLKVTP